MKRILSMFLAVSLLTAFGGCALCRMCFMKGTCAEAPENCTSCADCSQRGCRDCGSGDPHCGRLRDPGNGMMAGQPPTGAVTYPYYTTRGPRDFLAPAPPSIGP